MLRSILDDASVVHRDHVADLVLRDTVLKHVLGERGDIVPATGLQNKLLQRGVKPVQCKMPQWWDVVLVAQDVELRVAEENAGLVLAALGVLAW